jgi:hypothetical protein
VCGVCVFSTQQTHSYFPFDLTTAELALNEKSQKKKKKQPNKKTSHVPGDLGATLSKAITGT